ncbi:MAG: fasciclin domain-containing protein [Gemmatimonadota bacterium]|jgi:uncharacterized surface protein with fasciclin (FAS1) repeats
MHSKIGRSLIAGAAVLALSAAPVAAQSYGHDKNLVETAVEAGSFSTLATALEAAGLVETLASGGPFTVFAPTDEAFAKLPEGTLESLLDNPEQLRAILTYHVVPGTVTAEQVVGLDSAGTVNGQDVRIRVMDGKVMVDEATVTTADVMASNGVIHVIDQVMLPEM